MTFEPRHGDTQFEVDALFRMVFVKEGGKFWAGYAGEQPQVALNHRYFRFKRSCGRGKLQADVAAADYGKAPAGSPGVFESFRVARSAERRVGKDVVGTWRTRWSPAH